MAPKSKSELMRRLRQRRKSQGLILFSTWIHRSDEQAVRALLQQFNNLEQNMNDKYEITFFGSSGKRTATAIFPNMSEAIFCEEIESDRWACWPAEQYREDAIVDELEPAIFAARENARTYWRV